MTQSAMTQLQNKSLLLIGGLLKGIDKVALIDFPEGANVGDSMIWLGEIELLRKLNKKIVYSCSVSDFKVGDLAHAMNNGAALLINGGGNFGSVWPHHHALREYVLARFADKLIIQLPQSICFENDDVALARTRDLIADCENFHLLVRDEPSYNFALENFNAPVHLCPDSAFFLSNLAPGLSAIDVLYLRRTDREAITLDDTDFGAGRTVEIADWNVAGRHEKWIQGILRRLLRYGLLRNRHRYALHLRSFLAAARIQRGVRQIGRARCVITDRLHAHVLSVLLNRPNCILDNSNGKVFAFYEAWTQGWSGTQKVKTIEEAFTRASAIVQRGAVT